MTEHSGTARLRAFLRANIGRVVSGEELRDASGLLTYSRRIRELRALGWPIQSVNDNRSLAPDEYILTAEPPDTPPPQFARGVPARLRSEVLSRNNSVCQICGAVAGDRDETGRRVRLHVDHIEQQREGGPPTLDNLRTLCSRCNEGSRDVEPRVPPSLARLKGQMRRAAEADQREVYEWLRTKFESPS